MFRFSASGISLTIVVFLTVGCTDFGEPAEEKSNAAMCSSSEPPTILSSKFDDDDGDGVPVDEEFPTINDEDDDIADHTWIVDKNGVYHLFFHNEGHVFGIAIEHYISTDFSSLEYVGEALRATPGTWDSDGLWAPHIVEYDNTYFMFYTGVKGFGADAKQRIGLATSTDLFTWARYPVNDCPGTAGDGCLYECDEPWTTWDTPGDFNQQCRDPFVIWDTANQRGVMFATARSTNQFGTVAVAYSTDLTNWVGAGFINATRRLATGIGGQTTGGQCENPFVVEYGGTHYLLFTDWRDPEDSYTHPNPRTIAQYATSSTLAADASGSMNWTYRGYIPDPGVNAIEVQRLGGDMWIMSQSISNPASGVYWTNRRELRLKCMTWTGAFSFDTSNLVFPSDASAGVARPSAPTRGLQR